LTKGLGILLLHDNARPHIAAATANLFNSWGWEILPHPSYSPDFTPSDFHLVFPKMKKHLRGQRFHSNEDVQNEVKKCYVPRTFFFYEGLDKLIYRFDKCLNRLGDYVGK
jgi:histone-lysine N-methyltransferase SETMAR